MYAIYQLLISVWFFSLIALIVGLFRPKLLGQTSQQKVAIYAGLPMISAFIISMLLSQLPSVKTKIEEGKAKEEQAKEKEKQVTEQNNKQVEQQQDNKKQESEKTPTTQEMEKKTTRPQPQFGGIVVLPEDVKDFPFDAEYCEVVCEMGIHVVAHVKGRKFALNGAAKTYTKSNQAYTKLDESPLYNKKSTQALIDIGNKELCKR